MKESGCALMRSSGGGGSQYQTPGVRLMPSLSKLRDDDLDAVADRMDAAAARVPPACPESAVGTLGERPATS